MWYILSKVYHIGVYSQGDNKKGTTKRMTYKEEQEHLERIKLNRLKEELPEYMGRFFTGLDSSTSIKTRVAYAIDMKNFLQYVQEYNPMYREQGIKNIPLIFFEELTAMDIEEYLEHISEYIPLNGVDSDIRQNKNEAKMRKLASLKAFYKYNNKNSILKANPTLAVDMPKLEKKNIIILEDDEMRDFMYVVKTGEGMSAKQKQFHNKTCIRDTALYTLLLGTGMRVSELVGLDIDDVDLKRNKLRITRKGGNEATIYIGEEVAEVLRDYIENDRDNYLKDIEIETEKKALFFSKKHQRLSVRQIEDMTKKYAKIAIPIKKGKVTPHKMRSTFATNAYNMTQDAALVANMLGHSSTEITMKKYAKMDARRVALTANEVSKKFSMNMNTEGGMEEIE